MSVEIERKFLLSGPPDLSHPVLGSATRLSLEQVYLRVGADGEERIRHSSGSGASTYVHTLLRPLRRGVREIEEREIAASRYQVLRRRGDPERRPVVKDRWLFTWDGRLYELDDIHQPVSRACRILEIQLDHEGQKVTLPDFLPIDREVTGVPEFSNADIARG